MNQGHSRYNNINTRMFMHICSASRFFSYFVWVKKKKAMNYLGGERVGSYWSADTKFIRGTFQSVSSQRRSVLTRESPNIMEPGVHF